MNMFIILALIASNEYSLIKKIGEGSFSDVLKCEHKITGVCYAAKRLKKVYKSEMSIVNCAEIIASQKLPYHPNVLNMLEYHYDSLAGRLTFIFELMDMSMYDYLKKRRKCISENKVKNYLYQMLKGIEHLHKNGIFHRDVKPENILIKLPCLLNSPLGHASCEIIKLADLGSIRGVYSSPPYTEYISTRWYRSPECLLTIGHYGSKMDIWAAGCVFYEMLTLKPLFPGANEIDQLDKIHHVTGSPNLKHLSKLKTKSRNCTFFPKITGTGVDPLLPNTSSDGKRVLRVMIEYEPDKRINARRLLKMSYFDDVKKYEACIQRHSPHPSIRQHEGIKRSMGDDWSVPIKNKISKVVKREHYSDEQRNSSKLSTKSKGSKESSKGSTKSDIPSAFFKIAPVSNKPHIHKAKETSPNSLPKLHKWEENCKRIADSIAIHQKSKLISEKKNDQLHKTTCDLRANRSGSYERTVKNNKLKSKSLGPMWDLADMYKAKLAAKTGNAIEDNRKAKKRPART